MKTTAQFFLYLAAVQLALGQPMIPPSNISPVENGTLLGRYGSGSGRGQLITIGSGLSLSSSGVLTASGGGGGAPINATYITQTPDALLTNEQALSLLSTGIMRVTTTTGVISSLPIPLAVPNGGTGIASATANAVITGNGTGAFGSISPGTSGNVLTSNGTAWTSAAAAAGGNVTAAGTLDSGNIVLGQGGKAVATSSVFSISGSNATVTGNLSITGGTTFNNLTTSNLSVTGNITATGVGNGTLLIGNTTGGNFAVSTLTAGDNITITNGPGTITINATGGGGSGNVTVTGTPTSGQLAQWSSASNIVGITTANTTQGGTGQSTYTKGDILVASGASTLTKQAVGTDGYFLTANSSQTNGVQWVEATTPPGLIGFQGVSVFLTSNTTSANNNNVISFSSAEYDTTGGSLWVIGDPTKLGPIPASWNGKRVRLHAEAIWASGLTSDYRELKVFRNGDTANPVAVVQGPPALQNTGLQLDSREIVVSTGDYFQLNAKSNGTETIIAATDYSINFSMSLMAGYGAGTGDVVGPASSTDEAVARFNGSTGQLLQNTANLTLSDAGAFTFADGVRQTFNPDGTNAGINVGSVAGDPSAPSNGDIWYDSTANELTARINGSNVALGSGGSGGGMVLLASGDLGSAQANIDITSISSSYRHLKLFLSLRGTTAALSVNVIVTVNGDATAANYLGQRALIQSSQNIAQNAGATATLIPSSEIIASTGLSGSFTGYEMTFYEYASAKKKFVAADGGFFQATGSGNYLEYRTKALWNSTSAINQITISASSGNLDTGSTYALYGLEN